MWPLILVAALNAAGMIGGAKLGSKAAGKAADTQAESANYAATLQKQAADEALAFQKTQWEKEQENIAPWLQAGKESLGTLSDLMKSGELTKPFTFTAQDLYADPSYDFRLSEGQKALERSASARGGILSGGTLKALTRYAQDYASTEYGTAYNRAFNTFEANQANRFNRLASMAGVGQTAANQLGQSGQNYANTAGNIVLGSAANIGDLATQAANARASGYVGGANAWTGALSGTTNNISNMILLSQLLKKQP